MSTRGRKNGTRGVAAEKGLVRVKSLREPNLKRRLRRHLGSIGFKKTKDGLTYQGEGKDVKLCSSREAAMAWGLTLTHGANAKDTLQAS